ncbi:MAG: hypothetical protein Tsb004_10090 [Allomuricauda sp.]
MLDFLNFESSRENIGVVKASVHKSGKLGFSSGAQHKMKIDSNKYYKVGFNDSDENDESIYLVETNSEDVDAFKANKAGNYYYLRLKHVFEKRNISYKDGGIIYDIYELEKENIKYYKLKRRK